jgi:hypothetical protein
MVARRRLQAADLFALGKTRAEVAGDLQAWVVTMYAVTAG